jgi:hypothetical protein
MVNRVKPSCEILDHASRATYFTFDNDPLFVDSGSNSLQNTQQSISLASSGHSSQAVNSNNSSSFVQISGLTGLGVINQSFSVSLWIRPYVLEGFFVFVSRTALDSQCPISLLGFDKIVSTSITS